MQANYDELAPGLARPAWPWSFATPAWRSLVKRLQSIKQCYIGSNEIRREFMPAIRRKSLAWFNQSINQCYICSNETHREFMVESFARPHHGHMTEHYNTVSTCYSSNQTMAWCKFTNAIHSFAQDAPATTLNSPHPPQPSLQRCYASGHNQNKQGLTTRWLR
jgi:hypothetical protein